MVITGFIPPGLFNVLLFAAGNDSILVSAKICKKKFAKDEKILLSGCAVDADWSLSFESIACLKEVLWDCIYVLSLIISSINSKL